MSTRFHPLFSYSQRRVSGAILFKTSLSGAWVALTVATPFLNTPRQAMAQMASAAASVATSAATSKAAGLPSPAPRISAAVGVDSSYLIGPDDVVSIVVQRHPEFSTEALLVPGSGMVTLPVVGNMRIAGKTIAQIDAELTRKMKVRLLRPEVVVSLTKAAPRPLYVVGQVRAPGVLEFRSGWRITQALASSGGLSVDTDLASVAVSRGKTVIVDTPLLPILRDPSNPKNLALRVGDTLRFYERVVKINISGAVTRPGSYSVPRGGGVVEAIGLAGGPTDAASLTRATLRRADGTSLPLNLFEALRLGKPSQNITLREGDVLSVPEYKDRVSLLGALKLPGFYGLEDGRATNLADIIARAGGTTPDAALTRATLRHANGQTEAIDLYKVLVQGQDTGNLAIRANDVLTIPESRGITIVGQVQKPGTYKIEEGTLPRIASVIAQAGGLSVKNEQARISVSRAVAGGKIVALSVDPVSLLDLSSPAQNMLMQDGDTVSVAAIKVQTVSISGQVKVPGAYEIQEGDGLATLIARAGGQTENAALARVSITSRDRESKLVNAVSLLTDGRGLNFSLRDGDSVIIPRNNEDRILVVGAVTNPGSYPLAEDRPINIGDALSLAGGARNAKEIVLLRPTASGKVERLSLRMDKAENRQLSFTAIVQRGDVIYVPETKISQSTLGLVGSFLPAASVLLR